MMEYEPPGMSAVPMTYLIGRDGKVVSLSISRTSRKGAEETGLLTVRG